MTDKERVLMNIAIDTSGTVHDTFKRDASGWSVRYLFDRPAPQFIPLEMAEAMNLPLETGDIVRCKTNPNHRWGISEFARRLGHSEWLLKEIGSNAMLKMGNEGLDVLRFMQPERLHTGVKHKLYVWASTKAFQPKFNPDADYFKRFGGAEFIGDVLEIRCRPHIGSSEKVIDGQTFHAQPKVFRLAWSDKTRLKDIVAAMRDQGFGGDFEYVAVTTELEGGDSEAVCG